MNRTLDLSLPMLSPKNQTDSSDVNPFSPTLLEKVKELREIEDSEASIEETVKSLNDLTKTDEFNPNGCSLNEIDTGTNLSESGTNSRTNFEKFRKTLKNSLFGTPNVSKTSLDLDDRCNSMRDGLDCYPKKEQKSACSLQDLWKNGNQSCGNIKFDGENRVQNGMASKLRLKDFSKVGEKTDNTYTRHKVFNRFAWKDEQSHKPDEEEKDKEAEPGIFHIYGSFSQYYRVDRVIGEGAHGVVRHCQKRSTGNEYAVKIINFKGDDEIRDLITNEFKNHRKLFHENIIQVYELYIDLLKNKIFMILEYVKAKDVLTVISEAGDAFEDVVALIFRQILVAIEYMHSKGVCHRDLKPDNILVAQSKKGTVVKIIDFNVSKFVGEHKRIKYSAFSKDNFRMWTHTGTIAYTAPEVFTNSDYTEAVDMWSAGVVLYTFLCGYQPFYGKYVGELIEAIKKGHYDMSSERWKKISPEAKDLVSKLLTADYKVRYSPCEAMAHPWIEKVVKDSSELKAMYII